MKTKIILLFLFAIIVASCGDNVEKGTSSTGSGNGQKKPVNYKERTKEIYDRIVDRYGVTDGPGKGMYLENVPVQPGQTDVCSSLWYYDWLVSGISLMHQLGYEVGYTTAVDNYQKYWMDGNAIQPTVGGYGPGTTGALHSGKGDRYYDDNSIVGLNLVDAYVVTKEPRYLERAGKVVNFIRTAWSDHLGGGLWWREPNRNPNSDLRDDLKPSCANGYALFFLFKYHNECPENEKSSVWELAKGIYDWMYNNLQANDHNFIAGIQANGIREEAKDPALTGLMIEGSLCLYKATGDNQYLVRARVFADAAYDYFVKTRNGGMLLYPEESPWSSTKLFRAYLSLRQYYPAVQKYIDVYIAYMDNAYDHARNADGFFYEDFTGVNEGRSYMLLTQDAALESYAVIALYKDGKL